MYITIDTHAHILDTTHKKEIERMKSDRKIDCGRWFFNLFWTNRFLWSLLVDWVCVRAFAVFRIFALDSYAVLNDLIESSHQRKLLLFIIIIFECPAMYNIHHYQRPIAEYKSWYSLALNIFSYINYASIIIVCFHNKYQNEWVWCLVCLYVYIITVKRCSICSIQTTTTTFHIKLQSLC